MDIVPFDSGHLEAAAAMFCAGYARQRAITPSLPEKYCRPAAVCSLIRELTSKHPAVAAVSRGELVGYLGAMFIPGFRGNGTGAYCPEWGHAVAGYRPAVYEALYTRAAELWLSEGCLDHAVTLFAGDAPTVDSWFRLGFGMVVVDAVRDVGELSGPPGGSCPSLTVRPARPEEAAGLLSIKRELTRYFRKSPIFLPKAEPENAADIEREIADPQTRVWVAEEPGGRAVGIISGRLGAADACQVLRDPLTAAVTGAYVQPEHRRRGVGTLLLQALIRWAAGQSCIRVSVDFESANLPGRVFWFRHFSPVCYSLARRIDERVT